MFGVMVSIARSERNRTFCDQTGNWRVQREELSASENISRARIRRRQRNDHLWKRQKYGGTSKRS